MIDGAGKFRRWYEADRAADEARHYLTLGILTFMAIYNDYLGPLLFTTSATMRTVTVGIALVTLGTYTSNYGALMAFSTIGRAPGDRDLPAAAALLHRLVDVERCERMTPMPFAHPPRGGTGRAG